MIGFEGPEADAANWDARLRSAAATDADLREFQAWLSADPAHGEAYDRLQAMLRVLRAQVDLPELSALRDEARLSVRRTRQRRWFGGGAIAAGIAAIGLFVAAPRNEAATAVLASLQGEQIYVTSPQERTRVTLADGSLVTLDSGTRMAVRLSRDARAIRLISGRALFKVAKDAGRPFTVTAGDRSITALGTLFDVRVLPRELRVTLAEGVVAVRPAVADRADAPQILRPRQQLVAVAGGGQPVLRTVDIQGALAWAERQFFFEDEPLASAAEEISRSTDLTIIVDPAVAQLRINGMFRISDEAAFAEALERALPVAVRRDGPGRLLVSRPATRANASLATR